MSVQALSASFFPLWVSNKIVIRCSGKGCPATPCPQYCFHQFVPFSHWLLDSSLPPSPPPLTVAGRGTPSRAREWALPNTRKWIVRGDTRADSARDLIGKGHQGGGQQGKGTQENRSAMWLAVLGFLVMGLVSGFSLADHSDSGSFLVAHASLSQGGFQRRGFWEVGRTYGVVSVSSLFLTLPEFFRLVIAC